MSPIMPPPVPYCHGVTPAVVIVSSASMGAAATKAAMQSCRKMDNAAEIIFKSFDSVL